MDMDSVVLWLDEENEERIQRKILRDNSNIMGLSSKSFVKNYRLSKDAFMYVLNSIRDDLRERKRSSSIPTMIKLGATLKFLAQGGYQHQIGQDRFTGLAQQSVSTVISEVCRAIEKQLCPKHINFNMTNEEKTESQKYFHLKSGIPGIVAVVDGTHIQMLRPRNNEHLFFNRKLKHSINAMVICDHRMFIRAVNGRYGGASHDSHVWNLSNQRQYLENNFKNGDKSTWIIGDSGYPLEPWMLVPYRNAPENSLESLFNDKFSKARSTIERVFGVLKARFRCLLAARELHYAPEKVTQILNACCALHNICLMYNVEDPPELSSQERDDEFSINNVASYNDAPGPSGQNYLNIAKKKRDNIRNNLMQ